ncbi:MAG: MlaD family protein [Thiogranum sp.]|nr:MlaD family protein [Thiogranum sp.]
MAEQDRSGSIGGQVPDAVVEPDNKGLQVVWLLPLIAALIGGWLLFKTVSEQGPEFVIRFQTAEGIEEGQTVIKYREVTIGQVNRVRFASDLSHVLVTAELVPGMERHLTETAKFWVVRPRIGGGEITGLGTLISGAYIAMDPGERGDPTRTFTGYEKPPVVTSDVDGTTYRLRADTLGSLTVASPVYFRQFVVGEVTEYALAENHEYVDIGIFIRAPHDRFVWPETDFWNVGGVDVSVDTSGLSVDVESMVALISGGIAFGTPEGAGNQELAPEDSVFYLYENYADSQEDPITTGYPYLLSFSDSLRGLNVGAPVEFRGVRLGTVKMIESRLVKQQGEFTVPVHIDLEPQRTIDGKELEGLSGEALDQRLKEQIEQLVDQGLRARLQSGNLLTGRLFVELELFPEAPPAQVNYDGVHPELPTMPGALSGITSSAARILERLENVPLEATVTNLNELLISTRQLVEALDRDAPGLAQDVRATLEAATATLESLENLGSMEGEVGQQLYRALEEIRGAARSARGLAEYLERHPEALIRGKGN